MNNLFLSLLFLGTSAIIWTGQYWSVENTRAANRQLVQELASTRSGVGELAHSVSAAQSKLESRRQELTAARTEAVAAAGEAKEDLAAPLDPAHEGVWPIEKPYFYLAKKHLGSIGYPPFTKDQRLSPEAATLFGMTLNEKAAVENAYQTFRDGVRELHATHAERLEAPPGVNNENHRELTCRIPARTNEFAGLRTEFESAVRLSLGIERAHLFLEHASPDLTQAYGQFGNENYTVTYKADRSSDGTIEHALRLETADRRSRYEYPVRFPIEPGPSLWEYRHLFGEAPLIPLPPKKDNP